MKKKVVIVTTGGTIAMRYDEKKCGAVPALGGQELLETVPGLGDVCDIEVVEFDNIPSFHITPEFMLNLSKSLELLLKRPDVSGVVVTHGTDTLEETAYFVDLYISIPKSICFTGAMRNASHIAPDGPHNLLSAVRTASSGKVDGQGVVVVMNEEIHAAKFAVKTHTENVNAFKSPSWGQLGYVDANCIFMGATTIHREHIHPEEIAGNVPILKIFTGMDNTHFNSLLSADIDGLVIEGFGCGNGPATIVQNLQQIIDKNIPIVLTSRVQQGRTLATYSAEGGSVHLENIGVILGCELSSQKARLKLMLTLGITRDIELIREYFEQ